MHACMHTCIRPWHAHVHAHIHMHALIHARMPRSGPCAHAHAPMHLSPVARAHLLTDDAMPNTCMHACRHTCMPTWHALAATLHTHALFDGHLPCMIYDCVHDMPAHICMHMLQKLHMLRMQTIAASRSCTCPYTRHHTVRMPHSMAIAHAHAHASMRLSSAPILTFSQVLPCPSPPVLAAPPRCRFPPSRGGL